MLLLDLLATGRFEFDLSLHVLVQQQTSYLAARYDRFISFIEGGAIRPATAQMIDAVTLPPVSSKSDIRALEATCIRLAEGQRLWRKYTSGTTGPRTSVFYDDKFYFEQLFVCVRKVCALGGYPLRSNDRVLSIMGNTGYADELFVDPCVDDLIYARIGCDERDPVSIQKMWSTLELFAPSVVAVKPSLAEALSLATWRLGLRIPVHRPKIVISSGQSLNHRARAAIDNIFGGRVINALITTEAGLVAGQDREDDAWLVDRSALDVVAPTAGGGALRVTSDANAIMRLSSYFLGDDVELLHDDCGHQRLRMIGGRPAAVATFDSGLVIDLSRFDHVAFELIGANDYRLACWPDQVLLSISDSNIGRVEAQTVTEQFFGNGIRVSIEQRDLSNDSRPRFSVITSS